MTTEEKSGDNSRKVRNEFKDLPIQDKISTLIELEIMTVSEGFEKLSECSISLGKKILETAFPNTCHESEKREARQSSE